MLTLSPPLGTTPKPTSGRARWRPPPHAAPVWGLRCWMGISTRWGGRTVLAVSMSWRGGGLFTNT